MVCIEEKPVVLPADLRRPRPMHPGRILGRDCEYERRGTAHAFCAVEPKAGRHYPRVTPDRSLPEFADYLREVAEHYPGADTIPLVMDNLSSHTRKAVVERYGEKPIQRTNDRRFKMSRSINPLIQHPADSSHRA